MSDLSDKVGASLGSIFPHLRIVPEYYINHAGEKLFFDFFVPDLRLFIECQGQQHYKYVRHFHKTEQAYRSAMHRDTLKVEWVSENNYFLLRIPYTTKVTPSKLLSLIHEVMRECLI